VTPSLDARIFLDASFTIALASQKDNHHTQALVLMERILAERPQLVTTRPVMLEIGDRLGKVQNRTRAVQALMALESDPLVQIVPLSTVLHERAFQLFQSRRDKEWGMTDCVSFVVMQDMQLTSSLTTDNHFREAGFRALLRDDV